MLVARFLVALAFGFFCGRAHAQDYTAVARAAFADGVAAFEREDFAEALTHFEEAHRIAPHPAVLVNIANCHEALGHPAEALRLYEQFLREATNVSAAQRREVNAAIARLRAAETQTSPAATPAAPVLSRVRVDVTLERSAGEGASVVIDGQALLPNANGVYEVAPGEHDIVVAAPGHVSESRHFTTLAEETTTVAVGLHATSSLADPFAGTETAPTRRTHFAIQPYTWAFAGLAAATLIGGTITGILALNANADFETAVSDSHRPELTETQRYVAATHGRGYAATARDFAVASDVLFVAAGLSATTFVVLLLTTSQQTDEEDRTATRSDVNGRAAQRWQLHVSPGGFALETQF